MEGFTIRTLSGALNSPQFFRFCLNFTLFGGNPSLFRNFPEFPFQGVKLGRIGFSNPFPPGSFSALLLKKGNTF